MKLLERLEPIIISLLLTSTIVIFIFSFIGIIFQLVCRCSVGSAILLGDDYTNLFVACLFLSFINTIITRLCIILYFLNSFCRLALLISISLTSVTLFIVASIYVKFDLITKFKLCYPAATGCIRFGAVVAAISVPVILLLCLAFVFRSVQIEIKEFGLARKKVIIWTTYDV